MADSLQQLETWAAPLLARLQPGARAQLARRIATELRRSNAQRIAQQKNPDGSPYVPRKQQARDKRGRIKRGVMFRRMRQARYMKVKAGADEAAVAFTGRVARIARVHQEGRRDQVRPGGPRVRYERRELLGFTATDRERIKDLLLDHLAGA